MQPDGINKSQLSPKTQTEHLQPIEHLRTCPVEPSHPPTITQIVIREILGGRPESKKAFTVKLSEETATALAEIEALYDAVVNSGVVNSKDIEKIEQFSKKLEVIQVKIGDLKRRAKAKGSEDLKGVAIGRAALNELKEITSSLNRIQPIEDKLQQSLISASDQALFGEFEGDALLAATSLASAIDSLKSLNDQAQIGSAGTPARLTSEEAFKQAKAGYTAVIDDWIESTKEGIAHQKEALLKEYGNANGEAKGEIAQLLGSLLIEQRAVIRSLLEKAAELKGNASLRSVNRQLTQAAGGLNGEVKALSAAMKKANISLDKSLPYGCDGWKALAEKHIPKKERAEENEWSPLAKRVAFGVLQGMQITEAQLRFTQKLEMSNTTAKQQEGSKPGWLSKIQSKITTIGATAAVQQAPPPERNTLAASQLTQAESRLESSMAQLNQTLSEIQNTNNQSLQPIIDEISLLKRELIRTSSRAPKDTCTIVELAHWMQEVDDRCYAIERVEHQIGVLMESARNTISPNDTELEKFGKKHANNIRLQRVVEGLQLEGVKVPDSKGMKSDAVSRFLHRHAPAIFNEWEALDGLYKSYKGDTPFLETAEAKQRLEAVVKGIEEAFTKASEDPSLAEELVTPDVIEWLSKVKENNDFLMVRSTGAEDSRKSANVGGNKSCAYIAPTWQAFCKAAGEVVASYFGYSSLQNRINADDNPFEEELKLAVTAQELIGEPIGGKTTDPSQIPVSLVLFTSEPLFVGNEKFRAMRISATYGHGEGVVGAQGIASDTTLILVSEAHPDRLYVMYDNKVKEERLAAVKTEEETVLKPVPNPDSISGKPALGSEMISRLYALGVVSEHFFNDNATDMEIVIKGDTIYPVQARPVNRQPANPSYVDRKKLAAIDPTPITDTFSSEVIVSGKSNVIFIKTLEELNLHPSLEQAEKAYNKATHKAVIVTEPEPANSHPVVNFSGLSVTCLLGDPEKIRKIMEKKSPDETLIIDSQTGEGFLVKGDPEAYVSQGYAVHPANLAMTVTEVDIGKPSSTPLQAPQEVKDLLLSIRSAATQEAALKVFDELKQHPTLAKARQRKEELETKIKEHSFTPRRVEKALTALNAIDQSINEIMEETEAAIRNAAPTDRLNPLLRLKALETILVGRPASPGAIGQYSVMDVDFIYDDAITLIDYQKKFDHPVHFSGIYLAANSAFETSSTQKWRTFLENLEPQVQSGAVTKQQIKQLQEMVTALEKTDMLPTWFAFFFKGEDKLTGMLPTSLASFFKSASIEDVLATLPSSEKGLVDKTLKLASAIKAFKSGINVFSDPKTFEEAFGRLNELSETLSSQEIIDPLMTASPIVRMMIQNTLLEGVDLYDSAIKAMKASGSWSQEEKLPIFRDMLRPYFKMLKSWATSLREVLTIPNHAGWPLENYIREMDVEFSLLSQLTQGSNQLEASRGFSVAAATFGSITAFNRHYPQTHEDFFTLTHQNLIAIVSNLKNQLISANLIAHSDLPENFKKATHILGEPSLLESLKDAISFMEKSRKFLRTGMTISDKQIAVNYNVPLNNHSAKLTLKFDKVTGKMSASSSFLGQARDRWNSILLVVLLLDGAGIRSLNSPFTINEQGLEFEWNIDNIDALKEAMVDFKWMCDATFRDSLDSWSDYYTQKPQIRSHIAEIIVKGTSDPRYSFFRDHVLQMLSASLYGYSGIVEDLLKGIIDTNREIRAGIINIISPLVEHPSFVRISLTDDIMEAIQKGAFDSDNQTRASVISIFSKLAGRNDVAKHSAAFVKKLMNESDIEIGTLIHLMNELIIKGVIFDEAIVVVADGVNHANIDVQRDSLNLLNKLIQNEMGLDTAIKIAVNVIDNAYLHNQTPSFQILTELTKRGKGIPEAVEAAVKGVNHIDTNVQIASLKFFIELSQIDAGIDEAVKAALKGINNSNFEVKKASFELFIELRKRGNAFDEAIKAALKGEGIDEAINAAANGVNNPDIFIQEVSYKLFTELTKKGVGLDEAIVAAANGVNHANIDVQRAAINLLNELIINEVGLDKTIKLAVKEINDAYIHNQIPSFKLFTELIKRGKGIPEAVETAVKGVNHIDPNVQIASLEFFIELTENGAGLEEAIKQAANEITNAYIHNQIPSFKLFTELIKHRKGIPEAVEAAIKGVNHIDTNVQIASLEFLIELTKINAGIDEAVKLALIGINNSDSKVKKTSSKLFTELTKRGNANAKTIEAALKGGGIDEAINAAANGINHPDIDVQIASFRLFTELTRNGVGFDEALYAAEIGVNHANMDVQIASLILFFQLIEKGVGFDKAINAASKVVNHEHTYMQIGSLELFAELTKRGIGFDEAINAAANGVNHADIDVQRGSLKLFDELTKKGVGLDEAINAAANGVDQENIYVQSDSLKLFAELIKRGKGIPETINAAANGVNHADLFIQEASLKLFIELINNGLGFDEAVNAAVKGINSWDQQVTLRSFELFTELTKKGVGFDEAISAAVKGINQGDRNVELASLQLFTELTKKGVGFDEAISAAVKGINSWDQQVTLRSFELFTELTKKGVGFDEAISAAVKGINQGDRNVELASLKFLLQQANNQNVYDETLGVIEYKGNMMAPSTIIQNSIYTLIEGLITNKSEKVNSEEIQNLEATLPYRFQFLLWLQRMTQARS